MTKIAEIDFDYKAIRFIIKERIYEKIGYMILPKDLLNILVTEELIQQAIDLLDEQAQKIVLYRFRKKPIDVKVKDYEAMIRSENEAEDQMFSFILDKISFELSRAEKIAKEELKINLLL